MLEKVNLPFFENKANQIIIHSQNSEIFDFVGFIKNVIFQGNEAKTIRKSQFFSLPNYINIINYIIVNTDIIEEQYFGNGMSKILRSLPVKVSQNGDLATYFDNNHYVKVGQTYINTINIEIRDIFGNHIRFDDFFSYVIVNLHFKPKI